MEVDEDITSQFLALSSSRKQTLADIFKEFHLFVEEKSTDVQTSLEAILDALGNGTYLQKTFKYQLINKFRLHQHVFPLLLSGDSRLLKQALKLHWFFTDIADPIAFVDNIIRFLTYSARVKVLNKYGSRLQTPETAEKFFKAVHVSCGIVDAVSLLPACSQEFIRTNLWSLEIFLPPRIMLLILKSFPLLVVEFLLFLAKSGHEIARYKNVLRKFSVSDLTFFLDLCDKNHLKVVNIFDTKSKNLPSVYSLCSFKRERFEISKRKTRTLMATLKGEIIHKSESLSRLLLKKYFFPNLSPDETLAYFLKHLPPSPSVFLEFTGDVSKVFRHISRRCKPDFPLSAFKSMYGRDVTADEILTHASKSLLNTLMDSTKVGFVKNIEPSTVESLPHFWFDYLSDKDKIIWIEKKIAGAHDPADVKKWIRKGPQSYAIAKLKELLDRPYLADQMCRSNILREIVAIAKNRACTPRERKNLCAYIVSKLREGVLEFYYEELTVLSWPVYEVFSDDWDLMKDYITLMGKEANKSNSEIVRNLNSIFQMRLQLCFLTEGNVNTLLNEYSNIVPGDGDLDPIVLLHQHDCLSWFLSHISEITWRFAENKDNFIAQLLEHVARWNECCALKTISLPEWTTHFFEDTILKPACGKRGPEAYKLMRKYAFAFSTDWFVFIRKYFGRFPPNVQLEFCLIMMKEYTEVPEWVINYIKFASSAPSCLSNERIAELVICFIKDIKLWGKELKKIFPYYPHRSLLIYFLKHEPDFICENLLTIIEHDLKGFYSKAPPQKLFPLYSSKRRPKKKAVDSGRGVLNLLEFYQKCRLYEPFGIPNEIIRICKSSLMSKKEKREHKDTPHTDRSFLLPKGFAVRIAALMLSPSSYSKLISRFIPPKGKKAKTKEKAKALAQIQLAICDSLRDVSNPVELLKENSNISCFLLEPESFKGLCFRVSSSHIVPMLEDIALWPASFTKHIPFLIRDIIPDTDVNGRVSDFFKNESALVRRSIFRRLLKRFNRNENQATCSSILSVICLLKAEDFEALRKIFSHPAKWEYSSRSPVRRQYLRMLWRYSQDELSYLVDVKNKFISLFIHRSHLILSFEDDDLDILLTHDLSHQLSSPNPKFDFVIKCLLYSGSSDVQSARLTKVVNSLKPLIALSWSVCNFTDEHVFGVRVLTQKFLSELCCGISCCRNNSLKLTDLVIKTKELFGQLVRPENFFREFIFLDLALLQHRHYYSDSGCSSITHYTKDVAIHVISWFVDQWDTMGIVLEDDLLVWCERQFKDSGKDRVAFLHSLASELIACSFHPCQTFGIKVLRSVTEIKAHISEDMEATTKIIELLQTVEHPQVRAAANEWLSSLKCVQSLPIVSPCYQPDYYESSSSD